MPYNSLPKHLTRRGNYRVELEYTRKNYRETLYFDSVFAILDSYGVREENLCRDTAKVEKAIAASTPGNRIQLPTRNRINWFIAVDEHVIVDCKWNQRKKS